MQVKSNTNKAKAVIAAATEAAEALKICANPQRLQLLCFLIEKERSVQELEELLSISQSNVSQQLTKLKDCGIVQASRDGKYIFYSIIDKRFIKLILALKDIFC